MRLGVVVAVAVAAAPARGESPAPTWTTSPPAAPAARTDEPDPHLFAEPQPDESPTPYACTLDTLASGVTCVFESTAPRAPDPSRQASENAQTASRLAERMCQAASRHPQDPVADPDVLASCRRAFSDKAMACGTDGTRAVLDAEGRFSSESRLCYAALSEVLSRAQTSARAAAPCCRCLVGAKCVASAERCTSDGLSQLLEGAAARCADAACRDVCGAYVSYPGAAPAAVTPIAAPPPGPDVWQHRHHREPYTGEHPRGERAAEEERR